MEMRIGQYDFSIKGKKAVLKEEVGFYNSFTGFYMKKEKKIFPAGTEVTAHCVVHGTGLILFNFNLKGEIVQFPLRESKGKFEFID